MHSPFFENIQITLSKLTATANSAASTGAANSKALTGIQQLKKDEYFAIAGGPQVQNDPQQ
ncbi:hypothetical protein [Janthinobacterium sp. HH01]|uniref:hypothetical protein n=1 Tax=Janthinobacterium sp. HH01 TaxID=1198452 RepID=UPI001267A87E|nr:hypothetical protein [Janthinobacterium sp. HH01]